MNSSTTRHHPRCGSSGRKHSSQARSNRPAPLTKRSTSQVQSSPVSPGRPTSRGSLQQRQAQLDVDDLDGEDDSMASFLQFCATCEKQIVTPSISILYCSEACRRRDSAKSIPSSLHYSPPLSPYTPTVDGLPHKSIVPRRSPTVLRPLSTTFSELSLYELNSEKQIDDDDIDESTFGMPTSASRPYLKRTSTSEDSSNLPSLVHTPSSSYGAPDAEAARPLPRKHSCAKCAHRGIDLVTPMLAVPTTVSSALATSSSSRRGSAPITNSTQALAPESARRLRASQPSNVYRH